MFIQSPGFSRPVVFVHWRLWWQIKESSEPTTLLDANHLTVEVQIFWWFKAWEKWIGPCSIKIKPWKIYLSMGCWKNVFIKKKMDQYWNLQRWHYYSFIQTHLSKDIKASVAYVAPFPTAQEDHHYQSTITKNSVGTEECRKRIFEFQNLFYKIWGRNVLLIKSCPWKSKFFNRCR